MTRSLFLHKDDWVVISARMNAMDPKHVKDIRIPLHPGALKFYREIGAVK